MCTPKQRLTKLKVFIIHVIWKLKRPISVACALNAVSSVERSWIQFMGYASAAGEAKRQVLGSADLNSVIRLLQYPKITGTGT